MQTANRKPTLLGISLVRENDDCPDLSHLGSYSNRADATHIDRQERGDMGRHEYRYFNCGCGEPAYIEADYARYESYNADAWHMVGVYAVAEVEINGTVQTIRSGGRWGVESDSGEAYFATLRQGELAQLSEILASLGLSASVINAAVQDADWAD